MRNTGKKLAHEDETLRHHVWVMMMKREIVIAVLLAIFLAVTAHLLDVGYLPKL